MSSRYFSLWSVLFVVGQATDTSFNRHSFDECTTWNSTGIKSISSVSLSQPVGIFINRNNTVYVADQNGQVLIWWNISSNLLTTINNNLNFPTSIFVTINGDIYVDNSSPSGNRVDRRILGSSSSIPVMMIDSFCSGLFIDFNDTLYCSIYDYHKVIKGWLGDNTTSSTLAAGTGSAGSDLNQLNTPRGIFVDTNFDLYVADSQNNRILRFRSGQPNGTTLAGSTSLNITITLNSPADVVVDLDYFLFIVDDDNNRIIRSSRNGFHCIIGCNGGSPSFTQLSDPSRMAFDSYGNIYVTDYGARRVLKFLLSNDLCNHSTTQPTFLTSTIEKKSTFEISTALSTQTSTFPHQGISPTNVSHSTTHVSSSMTIPSTSTSSFPVSTFIPPSCTSNTIGITCNISSTPCHIMQPCQNDGTCFDNKTNSNSYDCLCLQGFNGSMCENDHRPCQPNTCFNRGECNAASNGG
ncbi:unnamed protein product, partial [Adineta ricciae]